MSPKFDLEARTLTFAEQVISMCQRVSMNPINRELVGQVVRASGSVGANYRAANDTATPREFKHWIRIALREAKESHYWLHLLSKANPEFDGRMRGLLDEASQLKRIFAAIMRKQP
ncbi:MAG: four helix bundle protein [Candidatus Omnitrophica bacterium]|nr:four helix bundle protein [Candidatus Omnitrophota bacterium]